MITKETLTNAVTRYFLSDIIDFIPMKAKVKRKTLEGVIHRNLSEREQRRLSLNECLNFEENNYIIEHFINVLETKLGHCDLSSFYTNIKTLTITEKPKTLFEKLDEIFSLKASGTYSPDENNIRIFTRKDEDANYTNATKTHELIHLATSREEGDMSLIGFERYRNRICFATGLTEGYTEVINQRYFVKRRYGAGTYQALQPIVGQIENLVGKEQMEKLFFSNDLDGLITSMEKYSTREDVLKLIQKLDFIFKSYGKPGERFIQEKLCREARVDIANIRSNRFKQEFESGKINEEQFKEELFRLELFTHNLTTFFHYPPGSKKIDEACISRTLVFEPRLIVPIERYAAIVDEYYESKKDNIVYTYAPWKNKDGLGIDNIIIREQNIQTIQHQEISKGRDPDEVSSEISKMLSENSPSIPTKEPIGKKW